MKKVFILSHGLANNGIDIFVRNVATRLDPKKWEVSLILALDDDGNQQPREPEVRAAGIPIYRTCDLRGIKQILAHARKLYHILKEHDADVFHSNMDLLNGVNCLVAWAAGVPVRVSHSHTSASQYEKKTGRHVISRIYRSIMKFLGSIFANRKCGCSEVAMDYLFGPHWRSVTNACIINNGIDTTRFAAVETMPSSLKRIVSVGRLCEAKNPFFALEVMDELRKLRQDFVYEWVGGGRLEADIRRAVQEKGLEQYVQLLGVRNDVDQILPARTLFFMPSLFEGLPISLIEAQAAGLPCLISDTITREINCGGCAFQTLEASALEWARCMSDILDGDHDLSVDPEKLRKFDISYTVEQLEQVYGG